jgi:putative flavoprotein involved in K+ transport
MADYLESYVARFRLPVRTGTRVERVAREGDHYVVTAGDRRYEADNVVVAMASYQRPRVPAFASELGPDVVQLHSSEYRAPSQLRDGGVLLVGAGNSGAEIAVEVARAGHQTFVSGRDVGQLPFRIGSRTVQRFVVPLVFRVVFHRVLTSATPMGRRARPHVIAKGGPLIRTRSGDLAAAGVERVPRMAGVRDGRPVLEDGRALDVANVIWCTGFHPGFSWIDLPIFDDAGNPRHERGVCTTCDGMYFVGLLYLHAFSSTMIHGVERDAAYVVNAIAERARRRPTAAAAPVS